MQRSGLGVTLRAHDPAKEAGGPRRSALVTGASTGIGRCLRRAPRPRPVRPRARGAGRRAPRGAGEAPRVASAAIAARVLAGRSHRAGGPGAGRGASCASAPPDLLVNNAGFGTVGRFAELDVAGEEREVRLNVLALLRLTHAALGPMVERGHGARDQRVEPRRRGRLALHRHLRRHQGLRHELHARRSREELRGSGVRVQVLLPGLHAHRVPGARRASTPSAIPGFAWMEPEAVVEASLAGARAGSGGLHSGPRQPAPGAVPAHPAAGPSSRRAIGASLERALR